MKLFIKVLLSQKGQALVELLVAIGVSSVMLPAILTGLVASREGRVQQRERLSATALLTEAVEAVRSVRERSWDEIAVSGTYHPTLSGNQWVLAADPETISGFTRSITISSVNRDSNGAITVSGGSLDPSTKQVLVTVSWASPFASQTSATFYFTRFVNQTWVETTEADFTDGTKTNVIVTNTAGGEVTLAAGGRANWCEPNLSIAATDLPKQGVANGISAIEGRVFAGTGDNASGVSFANVTITNTNPPVASIAGTFSNYKTNGVFGEADYAYIATDTNAKEIIIFDIRSIPYAEIGYFDAPGPTDGHSIFVVGNVGYMTQGTTLRNFDLSSKTGARPAIDPDGVTLAATGTSVVVVGNYAYVAITGSTTEMQIIDISDPATLRVVGQADVNGQAAYDVFVNATGTRAYLVTGVSASQREFFIVDVSTKIGNRPTIGSYDTNGMSPKGVTVVPGNRAIAVGTNGEEYQVIDISSEASPTRCGGLQINTGINGVDSVLEADGDAYSYIITGDAESELKILEGGPGGTYAQSGTYESTTFEATAAAAFNRFVASVVTPAQTEVTFQFAGADPVSGSCAGATFTFVGPDGTTATRFATTSAVLPLSDDGMGYENPARCFRYKAYLSATDPNQSPVLNDITVNYSL